MITLTLPFTTKAPEIPVPTGQPARAGTWVWVTDGRDLWVPAKLVHTLAGIVAQPAWRLLEDRRTLGVIR